MSQLPAKKDAFLVKPIILVAVLFLIETVVWYTDISFLFTFLIGISVVIITVAFLLVGIKHIVHGHYKSALSLILAIPFLMFSFALPARTLALGFPPKGENHFGYAHDAAYYIKLTLHEKQYLEEIKLTEPDEKGFRYKSFIWSGRYGEGTELVYDESDELGLAEPPRTYGWWRKTWEIKVDKENEKRANATAAKEVCPYGVYKMKSHFYVVTFACG